METMTVTEFKVRALAVLRRVGETQESVLLTKRGQPIARVVPYRDSPGEAIPGGLSHLLRFEEDVVAPLGEEMWYSAR